MQTFLTQFKATNLQRPDDGPVTFGGPPIYAESLDEAKAICAQQAPYAEILPDYENTSPPIPDEVALSQHNVVIDPYSKPDEEAEQPTPLVTVSRKYRWYQDERFPLLPIIINKPADNHNTARFFFHWLIFAFWTLDTPSIELALVCDGHWGLGFIGMAFYLRFTCCIPCPHWLANWSQQNLWRKSPAQKAAILAAKEGRCPDEC